MNSSILSIARTALIAHQRVLDTVSQNIANAATPGYSRQEDIVTPSDPARMPWGMMGTGVTAGSIVRKRDVLLDDQYRTNAGNAGRLDFRRDSLNSVQNIFGEPSDAGMSSALDQFWNSWSDLTAAPNGTAERVVVQQSGNQVAHLFNDFDSGLSAQRESNLTQLSVTVDEINGLANHVADLNGQIKSAEISGSQAADLRDQRDIAIDSLATKAGARAIPQADGTITVVVGNSSLVDGVTARPLKLTLVPIIPTPTTPNPDIPVRISLGDSPDPVKPLGGQVSAMVQVLNDDIPRMRLRLNAMASQLVTTINAAHSQGFVFSGTTIPGTAAGNFFDPGTLSSPVTAASISLDSAVATDISKIAASKDPNAPLDNQIASQMAALRSNASAVTFTSSSGAETGSFLGFFRSTVTRLGLDVRNATDDATVVDTLTSQSEARRLSVSGVNTDEELIKMIKIQQAYVAATKLVKAADEMMQTILAMV
ncbi:MAG: flagellar hook-associated protein FlgK [Gemmatimonadaceae bacterium]